MNVSVDESTVVARNRQIKQTSHLRRRRLFRVCQTLTDWRKRENINKLRTNLLRFNDKVSSSGLDIVQRTRPGQLRRLCSHAISEKVEEFLSPHRKSGGAVIVMCSASWSLVLAPPGERVHVPECSRYTSSDIRT